MAAANGQGFTTYSESQIANGLQWMAFLLSWILFAFYAYQVKRRTCGWEGELRKTNCVRSAQGRKLRRRV